VIAPVSPSLWDGRTTRIGRDLRAIGWRARLDVKAHAVTFRRVPTQADHP
jgi:hypothetical protein